MQKETLSNTGEQNQTGGSSSDKKTKKISRPLRRDRKTRLKERLKPRSNVTKFNKDFLKWCRMNNIPIDQETHIT